MIFYLRDYKSIVIDQPVNGLIIPIAHIYDSFNITSITGTIMGSGTVDFNLEIRTNLNSTGSNVFNSSSTATTAGVVFGSSVLQNVSVDHQYLVFKCTGTTGTPNQIVILIQYYRLF